MILADSLENDLDSLALPADEIMAGLSQNTNTFHSSSKQLLVNEIFDLKLNKIIEAIQTSNTQNFSAPQFNSRPSYYNNRRAPPNRFQHGPRKTYRSNTFNQRRNFLSTKKRPDSTTWVGCVESALNTDPPFTIHDWINSISFVTDTGSSVSLLPTTSEFEQYYGPQDLLAVNHTPLTVQGF